MYYYISFLYERYDNILYICIGFIISTIVGREPTRYLREIIIY